MRSGNSNGLFPDLTVTSPRCRFWDRPSSWWGNRIPPSRPTSSTLSAGWDRCGAVSQTCISSRQTPCGARGCTGAWASYTKGVASGIRQWTTTTALSSSGRTQTRTSSRRYVKFERGWLGSWASRWVVTANLTAFAGVAHAEPRPIRSRGARGEEVAAGGGVECISEIDSMTPEHSVRRVAPSRVLGTQGTALSRTQLPRACHCDGRLRR